MLQYAVGNRNHFVMGREIRNDNKEAPIGIYLIYIEIFNQKGVVKKYRKVVTLARSL